ncbi:MAG: hypothetical protein FJ270_05715 [Planctomycetes bacterium]|nr:hypothetical protein [Planctomycetota bacterium]
MPSGTRYRNTTAGSEDRSANGSMGGTRIHAAEATISAIAHHRMCASIRAAADASNASIRVARDQRCHASERGAPHSEQSAASGAIG